MSLSKSKFISGMQCDKRLYLEVRRPELVEYDEAVEARLAAGHAVNDVARALHPGGVLIDLDDGTDAAVKATRQLMKQPGTPPYIFEATFKHGDVVVRTDVLKRTPGGCAVTEVKSSGEIKDYHYQDCAVQAWVVEGAGYTVRRMELAHIDSSFVYPGGGDYRGLFKVNNVTADIRALKKEVPARVKRFLRMLKGREPRKDVGPHCHEPFDCPFLNHCTPPQPDYPLSCLYRSGADLRTALAAEGYQDVRDIPPGRLSNPTHERIRRITASGVAERTGEAKRHLRRLSYPRYYLDFETIAFAVPIWKGTRPYQALLFQWSCDIEKKGGDIHHAEFLDITGEAPMRGAVEELLKTLGGSGPIFAYHHYEKIILGELARAYADLRSGIEAVIGRLVDLEELTRNSYYHPDMRGSWSIKNVLPTIKQSLNYANLDVQDGGMARQAYLEAIHPVTPRARRLEIHRQLLDYCARDTRGMVELVRFLSQ